MLPFGRNCKIVKFLFLLLEYKIGFLGLYGSTGLITYFLPLYLKEQGFSPRQIGVVTFTRSIGGLLAGFLISKWTQVFNRQYHLVTLMSTVNLVLVFPIGLLRPSTQSECLTRNVTSDDQGEMPPSDRSWVLQTDEVSLVFIIISALMFIYEISAFLVNTALHGGTMLQLGENDTNSFGHIRAWGAIGELVAFLCFGLVTSATVTRRKLCGHMFVEPDYHFMFYIIAGFAFITVMDGHYISIKPQIIEEGVTEASPGNQTPKDLYTVKLLTWLIVQFSRSIFFSVTHGFLNWHIENLGASPMVIGGLNMAVVFAQTIAFFSTRQLISACGHSNIIYADLLLQVARFVAFSLISDFAYFVPFLAIEGLMFASTWSATASYLSNQVPEERQTEVQGLLQTVHTSGKATGFLLSGFLTQTLGAPDMFLVFAGVAFSMFILFFIAHQN